MFSRSRLPKQQPIVRVAWLSVETPSRDGAGGQRRQFHQILALQRAGIDVHVAAAESPQNDTSIRAFVETARFRRSHAERFFRRPNPTVARMARQYRPAGVVVAHCESLAPLGRTIGSLRLPTALDFHNVYSRWYESVGDERESMRWRTIEARVLQGVDLTTCCSQEERAVLHAIDQAARIEVSPNAIDPTEWRDAALAPLRPPVVAIFGSWTHEPNRAGADWFVRSVWPTVKESVAGAQLVLFGPGDPPASESEAAGLNVAGRVDDLAAALGNVRVVAIPIVRGMGSRMKFPEALASGAAVVSTSHGAEGVDADGYFVRADDPDTFASACIRLLRDTRAASSLGMKARSWVLDTLTWDQATMPLIRWCRSLGPR